MSETCCEVINMAKRTKKVNKEPAKSLAEPNSRRGRPHNKTSALAREKKCIMEWVGKALKKETTGKDWMGVSTLGEGGDRIVYKVKPDENGQLAFIRDKDVPESAVECREAEKTEDAGFILPVPTAKLDERDLPEYVLMAFMQPGADFKLESTVTVGKDVRIVYQRDPEYFEAIITIGAQRTLNRRIEINSLVVKDGASYAVGGKFCDHPAFDGEILLNQPRVTKLYNFLCEKLGLD